MGNKTTTTETYKYDQDGKLIEKIVTVVTEQTVPGQVYPPHNPWWYPTVTWTSTGTNVIPFYTGTTTAAGWVTETNNDLNDDNGDDNGDDDGVDGVAV